MPWPPVAWEGHTWVPSDSGLLSRRMTQAHSGPYRSAVPPGITALDVAIPAGLQTDAEEAALEISRFDSEAQHVLGDAEIAPIGAVLMRSESAASSQIENLTVGARQLALAELGEEASANARTVSRNVAAMAAATDLAGGLSERAVLAMHAALMANQTRVAAGRWRSEQVWIGGTDAGPHQASFVPPHHDRVPAAMADLMTFATRADLPTLPHAALAHAQFETIHPFPDGNGRTGRALIHAMVRRAGLTRRMTVPISAGLLADTGSYIEALTAYRDGAIALIISEITNATLRAVSNGRTLLSDLADIHGRWLETITARRGAAVWRAADLLIGQPVVTVRFVQHRLGVDFNTAQKALDRLEDASIVSRTVVGRKRNRTWHAQEITQALDAFAERAGRRG